MLDQFLPDQVFAFLLVFARVGAAFYLMPGFGSQFVSARSRTMLAAAVAMLATPVVQPALPGLPDSVAVLALLVGGEIAVGLFIGTIGFVLVSALEICGMMVSYQSGLANASFFNPMMASQSSFIGTFLFLSGMLLVFATDLHHLVLAALVDSYQVFRPGALPAIDGFAEAVARVLSASVRVALQMAAPIYLVGLLFYVVLGLLARLMPRMMVFFIGIPINIMLVLSVLAAAIPTMMLVFLGHFEDGFRLWVIQG